jgi:hypothetical protein
LVAQGQQVRGEYVDGRNPQMAVPIGDRVHQEDQADDAGAIKAVGGLC